MCEFCHRHGEGKKWYLQAKNYSEDLLSDLRRRKFIAEFFGHPERLKRDLCELERLDKLPGFVRRAVVRLVSNHQKKIHFGQVVPVEEAARIFDFVTSIVRMACFCRHVNLGHEHRYCYMVSMGPGGGRFAELFRELEIDYMAGPDTAGLEELTRAEALTAIRAHEKEGLCHTVWTVGTPFIGGICNCDRSDCLAMQMSVTRALPVIFRAEYVAQTDSDLCSGCRACMRVCQFGAIGYSAAKEKAVVDARNCYGCGICRAVCTTGAIQLLDRSAVRAAARLW